MTKAGRVYTGWIAERYGALLRWYLTLTVFPRPTYETMYHKAFKFTQKLNRVLYPEHYGVRENALLAIFAIHGHREGHIHADMLLGDDPRLTPDFLMYYWLKVAGKRTRPIAQDIKYITDPKVAVKKIGYALRFVTWGKEPFIFVPDKELCVRRVCEKPCFDRSRVAGNYPKA